jgi:hypothetical protein
LRFVDYFVAQNEIVMKNRILVFGLLVFAGVLLSSCSRHTHVHKRVPPGHAKMPPGQVKKITGSKSAKPYAPGQQKKKK